DHHAYKDITPRGFCQGGRGAFTVTSSFPGTMFISLSALTDGTSNTVAIGECVTMPSASSNKIKGGIYTGTAFSTSPSACNGYRSSSDPSVFTTTTSVSSTGRGSNYAYGGNDYTYFNTILPPNSPSCQYQVNSSSRPACYSLSSFHSGGANVVLADGAVQFISETIDCGDLTYSTDITTGQSPYGVWGAMGSICGGESKSL
ncbi:MAG: DUF1559 domain-containing protein, partial [Planctomycetia bacterium]|nr:DUF1559 domain-containing protein [Planctomycetia bacterium]